MPEQTDKKFKLGILDGQLGNPPDFFDTQNPTEYRQNEMAAEAAEMLGLMIQAVRLQHKMSVEKLAEEAGLSALQIKQIEAGDLSVPIGETFTVAAILSVPLYEPEEYDPRFVSPRLHARRQKNALLQQRAFQERHREVDDDF